MNKTQKRHAQRRKSTSSRLPISWNCLKLGLVCINGIFLLGWIVLVLKVHSFPPEQQHPSAFLPSKEQNNDLARGVAGLPMDETPALIGAKRGTITCNNVQVNDDLVYWNHPQGKRDQEFKSPFASSETEKFLTFEADMGGWNNIRMSMEIIFVLAAATGRTLVLPPKAPFYLLGHGQAGAKSFGNFFPLEKMMDKIKLITMYEFVQLHGSRLLHMEDVSSLLPIADLCVYQEASPQRCEILHQHLREHGVQPPLEANRQCLIFDQEYFLHQELADETKQRVQRFCGKRSPVYYDADMHDPEWIHWDAGHMKHRLLNHFYSFVLFTNPAIDNYHKRFVRDYLHYKDEIYCAAGKIVRSLRKQSQGSYSALHIRRGDFQFKQVKISAEEWYNNTKEVWKPNELLYIATDERNKTWFDPLRKHHKLMFLDDYWDMAGLGELDKSYLGMIDTIVASNGRAFAGTWFSTFTGYINRMRGYRGMTMKDSWYSFLERKTALHEWKDDSIYSVYTYAYEWPTGWVGIDGDAVPSRDTF